MFIASWIIFFCSSIGKEPYLFFTMFPITSIVLILLYKSFNRISSEELSDSSSIYLFKSSSELFSSLSWYSRFSFLAFLTSSSEERYISFSISKFLLKNFISSLFNVTVLQSLNNSFDLLISLFIKLSFIEW